MSEMSLFYKFMYDALTAIDSASPEVRIKVFMEWRYDRLSRAFPHKVFSVAQASLDFFNVSLIHLEHEQATEWEIQHEIGKDKHNPIPSEYNKDGTKKSEYELNYIRWLHEHKQIFV